MLPGKKYMAHFLLSVPLAQLIIIICSGDIKIEVKITNKNDGEG